MIDHSFALVAYKDSPYLEECMESLKLQTVGSNIYISTSTPSEYISDIAKKHGIEVFVTASGKGIAHDWNFGLAQATTKYATLAHQDDLYMPEFAETCFKAAEEFNNTIISFTDYSEILERNDRADTAMLKVKRLMLRSFMPFKKNMESKTLKKGLISTGNPLPCPSVMYNLHQLSGFEFSKEFSINLDWEAWLRMAKMNGRFVYVPKCLLKHRIHGASTTTTGLHSHVRQDEDLRMFTMMWPAPVAKLLATLYSKSYASNNG